MAKFSTGHLKVVDTKHTCKVCDIRRLLLKASSSEGVLPAEAGSCRCQGPYQPGDYIYRVGDPVENVYSVTSGTVKCELPTFQGDLQVTGFFIHGELFGVEALGEQRHVNDAIAVERSWICALPIQSLENACYGHPEAQRELIHLISARARHAVTHLFSNRGKSSDQRVLNFLLDLEARNRTRRNWGREEVPLSMTKEDIANYLAIAPETLSRSLRRLHEAGVIHNERKSFTLQEVPPPGRPAIA